MTELYRHFDENNKLMYVGISLNTFTRLGQHRDHSKWFKQIKYVKIEHYPTRQDAMTAEKTAIKTENPMFNIALRKTMKEIETEKKLAREKMLEARKDVLIQRIVSYDMVYKLDDLRKMFHITTKELEKHVAAGHISVFYVEGRPSWKTNEIKMIPLVSGWALIDFINYLENKGSKHELH